MGGFGFDPHDAEWEDPNTGRTAYKPGEDDTFCEGCDGPIWRTPTGYRCACDDAMAEAGVAAPRTLADLPIFGWAWKGDAARAAGGGGLGGESRK